MSVQQDVNKVSVGWIKGQLKGFADLVHKRISAPFGEIDLLYIKSVSNSKTLSSGIIAPFYEMENLKGYCDYIKTYPGTEEATTGDKAIEQLLRGYIFLGIGEEIYFFDAAKAESSGVNETSTESITQGPSDALTEDITVNLNMIRRRYQSANLKMENMVIGEISKTKVAILYDQTRVDPNVLDELREKMKTLKIDILQAAGELEKYISSDPLRLLPKSIVTERPDRIVLNLSEGKVAIMMDTTGHAILLPSIFNDFFTSMDDKIQLPIVGNFLKLLRVIGVMMTLWLPALYVTLTSYNPEIIRVQIALLIAGSRATVPYPSFVEVLVMLMMMEFLTEASLRLPKAIGPTATTVGGLILGQAATAAGLVGNIMIILVSAVAISNFLIPLNMMSLSIRVLKYIFLFAAVLLGLVGVVVCVVGFAMYLCNQRSFGQPYFRLFVLDQWGKKKGGEH